MSTSTQVWSTEDGAVDGRGIDDALTLLEPYCDTSLTEVGDSARQNARRAWHAAIGVRAYAEETGAAHQESARTCMSDLLNDMRHLCDALAIDWDDVVRPYHYSEEIDDGDLAD
ncbi:hypothetical protein [Gordonia sihwensis]|uniref:hypothetical protein n=1 Tax=Gordonia sihwensis TaxID=173559 RepID=UPI0005F063FB|nr:hypothetical protein [Gordonia sihwensis]KJR10572.1 hypothetical protein UG54_00870 [Gordonia sihwensis]